MEITLSNKPYDLHRLRKVVIRIQWMQWHGPIGLPLAIGGIRRTQPDDTLVDVFLLSLRISYLRYTYFRK